jgi:tetratricopeptide (TPR) repeat protein
VAAARVVSIDYRSIVENAVAGLVNNTPDARRDVYSQARGIVKRHLQLMRLPEPIVEVEKLALDMTIRKIERQWRARQSAEKAVHDPDVPPERKVQRVTVVQAFGSLGGAIAALGQALASLLVVLGLRPVVTVIAVLTTPLRMLFSPIGIAAALPIVAMAIFFIFFVDNNAAYKSLMDGPAGRWLSRVSHLDLAPTAPARRTAAKAPDRAPAPASAAPVQAAREPMRLASVDARPVTAESPARIVAGDIADSRIPTRIRPVRAEFAAAPEAPASIASACGSGMSLSDRMACAAAEAEPPPAPARRTTQPPQSTWLDSYAEINGVAVGRPGTPDAPPAGEETSAVPVPDGTGDQTDTPPIVTLPDDPPRPAPAGPRAPLIRPTIPKVLPLIESGRRAVAKGDLDKAVRDFGEAIRIDPKFPDSYAERGQANFKLGETDRAIADYTAAITRDPQHGGALRSRGMAYLYRGTPDLALNDLSKAIELTDNDPNLMPPIELFYARRSRAAIYDSKQQFDREIKDCTALIESYSRDVSLVEALKANYGEIGAANIVATIYRQRANGRIRLQDWQNAVADLTAAIPLSSDRGYSALIDRAKLYEGLGQRDQAIADVQTALAARPGSEEARLALRRLGATATAKPATRGL